MRTNYETCIVGEQIVLVPYRPEHVKTYHEWMRDPMLLEATGSEPLSLQEEIAMQESWREDDCKCTFIVLAREECNFQDDLQANDDSEFVRRNLNAMVGDVNLFLSNEEDDCLSEEDQEHASDSIGDKHEKQFCQAELDIMIAEQSFQKRGMGREASCLMMLYGAKTIGIRRFFCKINEDNHASKALFAKLGFTECDYAECFRQHELELKRDTPQQLVETIETMYSGSMSTFACPTDRTMERKDC